MNKQFIRHKVKGITITQRVYDDSESGNSGFYRARARSKQHADRLAHRLGWFSRCGGVGRSWEELYYDGRYLVLRYGMDT